MKGKALWDRSFSVFGCTTSRWFGLGPQKFRSEVRNLSKDLANDLPTGRSFSFQSRSLRVPIDLTPSRTTTVQVAIRWPRAWPRWAVIPAEAPDLIDKRPHSSPVVVPADHSIRAVRLQVELRTKPLAISAPEEIAGGPSSRSQKVLLCILGSFAERGLLPMPTPDRRMLATDIDVLVSEYGSGFHLTRGHVECKSGNFPLVDRIPSLRKKDAL
jgi:hypothetical protein